MLKKIVASTILAGVATLGMAGTAQAVPISKATCYSHTHKVACKHYTWRSPATQRSILERKLFLAHSAKARYIAWRIHHYG